MHEAGPAAHRVDPAAGPGATVSLDGVGSPAGAPAAAPRPGDAAAPVVAAPPVAAASPVDAALCLPGEGLLRVAVRHVPAAHHGQGGDVYEIIEHPEETLLLLADVRGKGAAASGLAQVLRELFRVVATFGPRGPGSIALALDEAIQRAGEDEDFATAVLLRVDCGGAIESVNCGHPRPLIVTPTGLRALNTTTCLPLGLGTVPVLVADQLQPAERLFLYTDGVSDARDPAGQFFDVHRQHDLLGTESLETALDALLGRVVGHVQGTPDDDLTLILAQPNQGGPSRRTRAAGGGAA